MFDIEVTTNPTYKDTSFDATVNEITAWYGDDSKTPAEKVLYLKCYIKWDGCSHFWFGEEIDGKQDGYLHLCGLDMIKRHADLINFLYRMAATQMGREKLDD